MKLSYCCSIFKIVIWFLASFVLVIFVFASCSYNRYSTVKEYRQYIEVKSNGLILSKKFDHLDLVVKNIPVGMRVLQDIDKGATEMTKSAMFKEYSQSIMFSVSLVPSVNCPVKNLNYYGLASAEEFVERQKALDFSMAQYFILKSGDKRLAPQICHFECDYAISGKLTFLLLFAAENSSDLSLMDGTKDIKLIFNDPFFDTGGSEFNFLSSALLVVPRI